jgi:hypothetical protein
MLTRVLIRSVGRIVLNSRVAESTAFKPAHEFLTRSSFRGLRDPMWV